MEGRLAFAALVTNVSLASCASPDQAAPRCLRSGRFILRKRKLHAGAGATVRMVMFPNTSTRMLLVADLDGAVVEFEDKGKDTQRAEFDSYWTEKQRARKPSANRTNNSNNNNNNSMLAYLTNASVHDYLELSKRAQLMAPDYLIAQGGTLVYKMINGPSGEQHFELDAEWQRRAEMQWDKSKVSAFVAPALKESGVETQVIPERENAFRVSYQLPLNKVPKQLISRTLPQVGVGLVEQEILTNFQVSERSGVLDIESFAVGRGQALWYLRETLKLHRDCVLAACAQMEHNEILFLGGRSFAVATGNAESALVTEMQLDESPLFYYATKTFCGGILEGLSRFGFRDAEGQTFR